ncbi:MAG: diphosphomevalonate decarboxylase [Wenzhouxiangella sp.]|nr:MAG: diphosphomevalonate decarboxylase [Wenzhouxiangella sp.]
MATKLTARAGANIALVKYWGKRDPVLNLPAAGSLSITLAGLETVTTIELASALEADEFRLDGQLQDAASVGRILDLVGSQDRPRCRVDSRNNFPTGAGLASSASGYAALVVAADALFGTAFDRRELSKIARRGSGSAARSLYGGFCRMHAGRADHGEDCYAEGLFDEDHWPLEVVVAITDSGPKAISSRDGMNRTMATSPYYPAWVKSVDADLAEAGAALARRDFDALADVAESSALKMHASALAARPGLLYWNPATVACIQTIGRLRGQGTGVFFTIDAGPQVKAVCLPGQAEGVAAHLARVPGVTRLIRTGLGPAAGLA